MRSRRAPAGQGAEVRPTDLVGLQRCSYRNSGLARLDGDAVLACLLSCPHVDLPSPHMPSGGGGRWQGGRKRRGPRGGAR